MSPRSSLLKRAIAPLLAVAAATALCGPTRAATASLSTCQVENSGTSYAGIHEIVDCNLSSGDAYWQTADFHCTLLGGDGTYSDHQPADVNQYGVGDHFYSWVFSLAYDGAPHGTYNCWCLCNGFFYEGPNSGQTWNASTGGTDFVSY